MKNLFNGQESSIIRNQCLLRAFTDISLSFADWYQATQRDIEVMEQETLQRVGAKSA